MALTYIVFTGMPSAGQWGKVNQTSTTARTNSDHGKCILSMEDIQANRDLFPGATFYDLAGIKSLIDGDPDWNYITPDVPVDNGEDYTGLPQEDIDHLRSLGIIE
jgi:hypothetical protein